MFDCVGRLQASVPSALHNQVGECPTARAAEMSDVPPRLDLSVRKTIARRPNEPRSANAAQLNKYYAQRYRLFNRFDDGIVLDEVSWYSVTPEKIAAHIADRFRGMHVVLDVFSGAGGNSIQFALAGLWVVAVEIDAKRIELAVHNAKVYGVDKYIEFIHADAYEFLPSFLGCQTVFDAVFMSPPWGGPEYLKEACFDVSVFRKIIADARAITENVAILLPRNTQAQDLLRYFGACEMEDNYLDTKLKTVTVYFGRGLIRKDRQ